MPRPRAPEESLQWPLWGGVARLVIRPAASGDGSLQQARRQVDVITMAMDKACSRFRPDSEVVALTNAGGAAMPASALLRSTLRLALRAAEISGGAVDPTLGHALIAAGYDTHVANLPPDRPASALVANIRRPADWRDVSVDDGGQTVTVPDGVLLDLGATAKAHAADLAAAEIHRELGCPVLVSLCGDLALLGTQPDEPWIVQVVERPDDDTGPLVALTDCGVATSTTRARRWRIAGRPMHHLLDPKTGQPVRDVWRTVTTTANTCVEANTASTATVVKGTDGLRWLTSTALAGRLVAADGSISLVGGWPPETPA